MSVCNCAPVCSQRFDGASLKCLGFWVHSLKPLWNAVGVLGKAIGVYALNPKPQTLNGSGFEATGRFDTEFSGSQGMSLPPDFRARECGVKAFHGLSLDAQVPI